MSTAARIEELRKKFDENPRRYFAPLANELRKAGDLTQAIALCREHLPKQPGHMSGYIVFGQALFESGDLDEARTVFEQALDLDPENLIALHHLGHIARQQGDTAAARRWYERALDADPRNDDIAKHLAMLATPIRPQPAVPTPATWVDAVAAPPAAPATDPDHELAFLDAGFGAPRRDLGAIPTPAHPQEAVGGALGALPLAPTPDAALRAVDFDVVNASLHQAESAPPTPPPAAPEPIDLAFDDLPSAALAETDGSDVGDTQTNGYAEDVMLELPSDAGHVGADEAIETLPAFEAPAAESVDFIESAESVESVAFVADDPFAFADDDIDTVVASTAPEDDAVTAVEPAEAVDLEAAFEEGLVTAGWPEATEIATFAATPRQATPVSVDVPAEAAEAFGLEAHDDIRAALPEPEPEVLGDDADLMIPQPVPDGQDSLPWLPTSDTPTDELTAIAQALEEDARANGDDDAVSVVEFAEDASADDTPAAYASAAYASAEYASIADAPIEDVAVEDIAVEATLESAPPSEAVETTAFVTETMGELLVAQGFVDRAVSVYEELVRRRPYDPVLSARLAELRDQAATAAPVTIFTARERFAKLAARRVVRRTPARAGTPVSTPVARSTATPVSTPAVHTPAYPTPHDSLTALFGATPAPQDDFAAQALAEAFAPLPLEEAPSASFESSLLGHGTASRTPTPAYGAVRQPTPVVAPAVPTPASTDATAGDFSFDRFFPDPAATSAEPPPLPPSADSGASDGATTADDLAQFSAWLKGLGNS